MTKPETRCAICGYTEQDAKIHMDHNLCANAGRAPWERASSPKPEERQPEDAAEHCLCERAIENWDGVSHDRRCRFANRECRTCAHCGYSIDIARIGEFAGKYVHVLTGSWMCALSAEPVPEVAPPQAVPQYPQWMQDAARELEEQYGVRDEAIVEVFSRHYQQEETRHAQARQNFHESSVALESTRFDLIAEREKYRTLQEYVLYLERKIEALKGGK